MQHGTYTLVHFYGAAVTCVLFASKLYYICAFHLISSTLQFLYYLLCVWWSVEWSRRNSWYCIITVTIYGLETCGVIEEFSSRSTDAIFKLDAWCICMLERKYMMEMWFYCMPSWIGWFYSPQKTHLARQALKSDCSETKIVNLRGIWQLGGPSPENVEVEVVKKN